MACISRGDISLIKFKKEIIDDFEEDCLDRIPLIKRREMLLASRSSTCVGFEKQGKGFSLSLTNAIVKEEPRVLQDIFTSDPACARTSISVRVAREGKEGYHSEVDTCASRDSDLQETWANGDMCSNRILAIEIQGPCVDNIMVRECEPIHFAENVLQVPQGNINQNEAKYAPETVHCSNINAPQIPSVSEEVGKHSSYEETLQQKQYRLAHELVEFSSMGFLMPKEFDNSKPIEDWLMDCGEPEGQDILRAYPDLFTRIPQHPQYSFETFSSSVRMRFCKVLWEELIVLFHRVLTMSVETPLAEKEDVRRIIKDMEVQGFQVDHLNAYMGEMDRLTLAFEEARDETAREVKNLEQSKVIWEKHLLGKTTAQDEVRRLKDFAKELENRLHVVKNELEAKVSFLAEKEKVESTLQPFGVKEAFVSNSRIKLKNILGKEVSVGDSASLMEFRHLHSAWEVKDGSHSVDAQFSVEKSYADSIHDTCSGELHKSLSKTSNFRDNDVYIAGNLKETPEVHVTGNIKLLHSPFSTYDIQVKVENMENCVMNSCKNFTSADTLEIKVEREILEEVCVDEIDHIPLQERAKMLASSRVLDLDPFKVLNCIQKTAPCDPECDRINSANSEASGTDFQQKRKRTAMDLVEMAPEPCALECDPINSIHVKGRLFNRQWKRKKTDKDSGEMAPEPCAPKCEPANSENVKGSGFNFRRKRKKTVTDSVEIALEEDAPGLLQVLIERGITIEEVKLYGDVENEDLIDVSSSEDSFVGLETVISKLFSQPSTLFKFAPIRFTKGSKPNYCLACLVSLVEQIRYLQFRKWPVEWGWCRDLQSFIFVFERHNRIVLERPEYGYATYFFELVGSLPIAWQIKRLVTVMKLPSCSRATLIENKSLLIGEDLTDDEARVLEEYGWKPNTGLGSMLNYCDRVVHDMKNEGDSSEWRSKIGKLLMDGHDGGTIVMANLPKKVKEYTDSQSPQIKLEL
ncbi:uncharacterized protein LOC143873272 isoform X2 [Tasmannia lanceolata]|uniref:uncharacterized protein LOC143873272 isoform X2 n=1 Tax=Tasmannia lanceolata TaxID=3420 RepID=UPI00406484DB